MAQRVTRHLRLLRQLKCLTASKTPTVLDYPRNFGNAAKDGLKGQPVGRCTILQIEILGILYLNVP